MIIFLDTEFTSLIKTDCEILSIGMVSEDGKHSLYAERNDYDPKTCSDFVVQTVLPLFGRYPEAQCSLNELHVCVLRFLRGLPPYPTMACDSSFDLWLLNVALGSAERTEGPAPPLSPSINLNECSSHPAYERAFKAHFVDGRDMHHALWDAQAMRAGHLAYVEYQRLVNPGDDAA